MPAYKDSKTGTWFVKFYCKDWSWTIVNKVNRKNRKIK